MKLIYIPIFLCLFSACKDNPVTPPEPPKDTPPVIQSFTVTPPSVEMGQAMKSLFTVTDDEGLDSLVFKATGNLSQSYTANRQKIVSDSAIFSFSTPGSKILTLTAYADGKTAVKYLNVGVNQNLPPGVDVDSLKGVEGQSGSFPTPKFAHDPEGKAVSISVKTGNPSINISVGSDSIRYSGIDQDENGSFPVTFSVSDGKNVTDKTIPIVIAARDVIMGTVRDGKIGMPVETSQPGMILRGPFDLSKSYLKIDNVLISMDANGNFVTGKLPHISHTLEVALVNTSNDSSYVATYTLPAGDQTFNPIVATNTGTGRSLASMNYFSYFVNFKAGTGSGFAVDGMLKSIDWTHAKDYTLWIDGTFTTQEQDEIEQTVRQEIYNLYLADSLQPTIYKAYAGEPQPLKPSTQEPDTNIILMYKLNSGEPGTLSTWIRKSDGIIECAIIGVRMGIVETKSTILQEVLSAFVAPYDLSVPEFANASVLYENERPDYLTPLDVFQLYNGVIYARPGQIVTQNMFWKLR
jgi:hypothetical protein